ncbi:hypothetical protein A2W24_00975 [Microgenomates group bacterium RBG_16_45_19]|nr:MAG: hypothetical protein A2W24_00975 [Microgenomates group bacterium RBG_16_45_19]
MGNYTVREVTAKTIFSASGIPGIDWSINPYLGCRFGCKYCYAYFVGRFRHPDEAWGEYVDVKVNAVELFKMELKQKLAQSTKGEIGEIFFSAVTDPYQGLEAKYQLTRGCLEVLVAEKYHGRVSILTKAPLVTRDIDLFKRLPAIEVGLTVTSTGDPISRYLETYAPSHQDRIKALQELNRAGIKTYAFVGPLLPHLAKKPAQLKLLFSLLKAAGVSYIFVEHLNLKPYIAERLLTYVKQDKPELLADFEAAKSPDYRKELGELIKTLAAEEDLPVAGGEAIHHPESGSWQG